MIRHASVLGARSLVLFPGGHRGHTRNHLRRLLRLALDELVPLAEDLDVRLAIEPVIGPEAISLNFAGGFNSMLELISDYPASRVGLVADLFYLARDVLATRDFSKFAKRIALVQISDLRVSSTDGFGRCLPGSGRLPINSWLNRLAHCNYRGPIELELHGPEFEFLGHQDLLVAGREFLLEHDQPVIFEESTHDESDNADSKVDSTKSL
jgi:sugar phosphate isomerase/epimerase